MRCARQARCRIGLPKAIGSRALLDILSRCHAADNGQRCVVDELQGRAARLQRDLSARQLALDAEEKLSNSGAQSLPDEKPPDGWERERHLVTDEVISSLELFSCDRTSCSASLLE